MSGNPTSAASPNVLKSHPVWLLNAPRTFSFSASLPTLLELHQLAWLGPSPGATQGGEGSLCTRTWPCRNPTQGLQWFRILLGSQRQVPCGAHDALRPPRLHLGARASVPLHTLTPLAGFPSS